MEIGRNMKRDDCYRRTLALEMVLVKYSRERERGVPTSQRVLAMGFAMMQH